MTEGTLVVWLAHDGDVVTTGQPIYRIETDKVESDVEAPVSGVLRTTGNPGDTYEVGTEIGRIEEG